MLCVDPLRPVGFEAVATIERDGARILREHPERGRAVAERGIQECLTEPGSVVSCQEVDRCQFAIAGRVDIPGWTGSRKTDDLGITVSLLIDSPVLGSSDSATQTSPSPSEMMRAHIRARRSGGLASMTPSENLALYVSM